MPRAIEVKDMSRELRLELHESGRNLVLRVFPIDQSCGEIELREGGVMLERADAIALAWWVLGTLEAGRRREDQ